MSKINIPDGLLYSLGHLCQYSVVLVALAAGQLQK